MSTGRLRSLAGLHRHRPLVIAVARSKHILPLISPTISPFLKLRLPVVSKTPNVDMRKLSIVDFVREIVDGVKLVRHIFIIEL